MITPNATQRPVPCDDRDRVRAGARSLRASSFAPGLFVLLWSTGFIGTKYVLHNAEPLTYLAIRMAVVVGIMVLIAAIARPKWPDHTGVGPSIVAGLLVHGFYLCGTAVAISLSIPAGLSALMPGLQPILTSTTTPAPSWPRIAGNRPSGSAPDSVNSSV